MLRYQWNTTTTYLAGLQDRSNPRKKKTPLTTDRGRWFIGGFFCGQSNNTMGFDKQKSKPLETTWNYSGTWYGLSSHFGCNLTTQKRTEWVLLVNSGCLAFFCFCNMIWVKYDCFTNMDIPEGEFPYKAKLCVRPYSFSISLRLSQ